MKTHASAVRILLAAALWGCIGLFYTRLSAVGFTPLQVVFIRVAVAALVMLVYLLFRDPKLFRIRLRDLWMFIGSGVASLAFFNYCYFNAMDMLSPSVAAVLLYTAPAFVLVMSAVFFRETITRKKILVLLATILGCMLVTEVFTGSIDSPLGIVLGLGSGLGYALYTIFGVVALRRYRTETITFYTFVTAAMAVFPLSDPTSMGAVVCAHPSDSLLYGGAIGILACVLPYLLYTKGLEGVPAGQASVMATLEPVVAAIVGVCLLGDTLSVWKVLGMVLILGGILVLNLTKSK